MSSEPRAEQPRLDLAHTYISHAVEMTRVVEPPSRATVAEAIAETERAVALVEPIARARPRDAKIQREFASLLRTLGTTLSFEGGRVREGEAQMRRSIAIIDGLTGEEDSDFNELDSQARNYSNLAVSLLVTRPEQAEAASSRAAALWEKIAGAFPNASRLQNNLAYGLLNLGQMRNAVGRRSDAIERSATIYISLMGSTQDGTWYAQGYARNRVWHGWILWQAGRPAEALEAFEQAPPIYQRLGLRDSIANINVNATAALRALGRAAEARLRCDVAIAINKAFLKGQPDSPSRATLAEALLRSGKFRSDAGDLAGAAVDWRRAVALFDAIDVPRRILHPRRLLPRSAGRSRRAAGLRRRRFGRRLGRGRPGDRPAPPGRLARFPEPRRVAD